MMPKVPEPVFRPSNTAGLLIVLGWLGLVFGLIILVLSGLLTFVANPIAILGGALSFSAGGTLAGGSLVLIALGNLLNRLDILCHYARVQAFTAQETGALPDVSESPQNTSPERREPTL